MSATNLPQRSLTWIAGIAAVWLAVNAWAGGVDGAIPVLQPGEIRADLSSLPDNERAALARIVRAARQMDRLYMRQVWPGTSSLLKKYTAAQNPSARSELMALDFFKGPWDADGKAFIAGVPKERPIGDFYPSGSTKRELDAWMQHLSAADRARALDSFTAIRRAGAGRFEVVPYSRYYAPGLEPVARELRAAADLTAEPSLKRYLRDRASALLDDNYYQSDVDFVRLQGPIDVVLGPYEVDDDSWFGAKTAFEASIAIVNERATRRIVDVVTHLQELEDHLPLTPELRGRKLGPAAPVLVLDVVYHGGEAGAGTATAGYGLPNDLRVLNVVGARTGTYSNILRLRYETSFRPIADLVLTSSDQAALQFEDILDEILMVRLFDSLGPQVVSGTTKPIADVLQEKASAAAQVRSMLLSLWGHRYLIEHGYRESREYESLYAAFLVPALARVRAGLTNSPSQGSTYILNHLLQSGAIGLNEDGRVRIDAARANEDIVRAAQEIISPMARGDADTVRTLLSRYVVVSPEVKTILTHTGATPPLQRYVYSTADQLDPPRH